jgi:hypothetical protein
VSHPRTMGTPIISIIRSLNDFKVSTACFTDLLVVV